MAAWRAAGLALAVLAAPAAAQPSLEEARRAAAAEREAAAGAARLAAEAAATERRLAERRVELGQRVQDAERAEATASAALAAARSAVAATQAALAARTEALRPLWPVARRLAQWPAETLLAAPVPPEDALRGLAVLQAVWRRVHDDAAAARAAATRATADVATAATRATALAAAEAAARQAVALLDRELEAARASRAGAVDAEAAAIARVAVAAGRARTLEAALERVARPPPTPAPTAAPRPEAVAASLRFASPVTGPVERHFGEVGPGGPAQGLTFAAAPSARVVAPCAGRAVFAGSFRSYGRLLILDCGGGLHAVLGGMARLDTEAGGRLLAGEPVGVLGAERPARLYVELRRDGEPVDPRPWLAGRGP